MELLVAGGGRPMDRVDFRPLLLTSIIKGQQEEVADALAALMRQSSKDTESEEGALADAKKGLSLRCCVSATKAVAARFIFQRRSPRFNSGSRQG